MQTALADFVSSTPGGVPAGVVGGIGGYGNCIGVPTVGSRVSR